MLSSIACSPGVAPLGKILKSLLLILPIRHRDQEVLQTLNFRKAFFSHSSLFDYFSIWILAKMLNKLDLARFATIQIRFQLLAEMNFLFYLRELRSETGVARYKLTFRV